MVQSNSENLSPTLATIFAMEREEGIEQGVLNVVLEMLKAGSSIDFIAKVTHLDKEEIEKLKELN